jgi:hypothetical protein
MIAGQRAMAVAMMHPEGTQGRTTATSLATKVFLDPLMRRSEP